MSQCPDVVELPSVKLLEDGFLGLLQTVMAERCDELRPDLEMTAWLLTRVGEAVTHAVAVEHPEWLAGDRFVTQVSDMMIRHIRRVDR